MAAVPKAPSFSTSASSPITLTHFILAEEQRLPTPHTGDLSILLHSIEIAAKYVS
jgi:hypothetical protein